MRKLLKCGARKRDRRANAMSTRKAGLSADHRLALSLLAGLSHGCTEAILLAHGFTIEMLIVLVRAGSPPRRRRSCMLAAVRSRLSAWE
jgi:hypothetical protein